MLANGIFIKTLKVKHLAGEQKATEEQEAKLKVPMKAGTPRMRCCMRTDPLSQLASPMSPFTLSDAESSTDDEAPACSKVPGSAKNTANLMSLGESTN